MTRSVQAAWPSALPSTTHESRSPARSSALAPALAVLLAAVAVSAPTIGFDFVLYDDDYLVYRNPVLRDLRNFPLFFDPRADRTWMGSEYLPVTTLSFALDYAIYGRSPHGFHATNVALYTVCCWLLYLVLGRFTAHSWAAAAGAILFAVHPLHTENFAWVADRKSLLNGVFTLISLLAYMRFRMRGDDRRWYAAALLAYLLAFFSKYTAVSLPGALLAYDLLFHVEAGPWNRKRLLSTLRRAASSVLPFFVVGAGLSVLAVSIGERHEIVSPRRDALWSAAINDPIIVLHYLRLIFFPVDQCACYLWPLRASLTLPAVLGYAVIGCLLGAAWVLRRKAPLVSFAVLWFFVLLVPLLNLVPKVTGMAERYLFQPSIAVSFVMVWAWTAAHSRCAGRARLRHGALAGVVGLLIVLAVASVSRSSIWRDSFSLWARTLEHPMASPTAYDQLGLAHLTLGKDPEAAIEVFRAGIENVQQRGTGGSRLAMELRFHLTLAHLASGEPVRAREVWQDLEGLCAASRDPALANLLAGWRLDLERHYPAMFD